MNTRSKYPPLNDAVIFHCLAHIDSKRFLTDDFIAVLSVHFPDTVRSFSAIGAGWKSVIGKNLSAYASNTRGLKKARKKKGNAQAWVRFGKVSPAVQQVRPSSTTVAPVAEVIQAALSAFTEAEHTVINYVPEKQPVSASHRWKRSYLFWLGSAAFFITAALVFSKAIPGRNTEILSTTGLSVQKSIDVKPASLVNVKGGTFRMGSSTGDMNEQPSHTATVGSFGIDKYEITYEKWNDVRTWGMMHGYTDLPAGKCGFRPKGTGNPVTNVNWYDAVKWCNALSERDNLIPIYYIDRAHVFVYRTGELALTSAMVNWTANGYRLPTETEWEFAARGGTESHGYAYSGSPCAGDVANYTDSRTHSVGRSTANELGLYDMSGNVYEWCWDLFGRYPSAPAKDPKGNENGTDRVLRGGSFGGGDGTNCRVTYRYGGYYPSLRSDVIGFRCVNRRD